MHNFIENQNMYYDVVLGMVMREPIIKHKPKEQGNEHSFRLKNILFGSILFGSYII